MSHDTCRVRRDVDTGLTVCRELDHRTDDGEPVVGRHDCPPCVVCRLASDVLVEVVGIPQPMCARHAVAHVYGAVEVAA